MQIITLPIQNDLSQYEKILKEKIPEDRIVRWYISKMNEKEAEIEVVFDAKTMVDK